MALSVEDHICTRSVLLAHITTYTFWPVRIGPAVPVKPPVWSRVAGCIQTQSYNNMDWPPHQDLCNSPPHEETSLRAMLVSRNTNSYLSQGISFGGTWMNSLRSCCHADSTSVCLGGTRPARYWGVRRDWLEDIAAQLVLVLKRSC